MKSGGCSAGDGRRLRFAGGVENVDTTGVDWTVDLSGVDLANDASDDWFRVENGVFEGRDLDGDAVWISPLIDISSHSDVAFEVDVSEDGNHESTDTLHVSYTTDGGSTTTDLTDWNGLGDGSHSLVDDWTSETITATGLSGTDFQLEVEMRNNANSERLRLEQAKVTGVAEPQTEITEASFNDLNQLVSRGGGGEARFAGTTDEPATVTVDGTNATLGNGGESFAATVDLPTGVSTVTVEATDVNSNTARQDYEVEVAAGSGQSLTFDANGNLLSDGAGQSYKWDAENRLIEITRGTETTEFAYDGMSRRTRITEKSNGLTTEDSRYIWDGAEIVERRAANGTTWEQRYYADGFVDAAEGDFYYTRDHLGSIREVLADDGVTFESQYDYGIWGEVERIAGTGIESVFRYTGHFYHVPSELHLTWFRAYDAELGRWISRDPIEELGGLNLYLYVGNDPVVFWDPFGLLVDQARYYNNAPPFISPEMQDYYTAKGQLKEFDEISECLADGAGALADFLDDLTESDYGDLTFGLVDALSTQFQRNPVAHSATVVVAVSMVAGPKVGLVAGPVAVSATFVGQFASELSGTPADILRALEEYLENLVDECGN